MHNAPPAETILLTSLQIHPVLLDIGSSGPTPEIWQDIASHSVYVGFDADAREMEDDAASAYYKALIVQKAVTSHADLAEVEFFLTASPHCSSVLQPDNAALASYLFAPLFEVERKASLPAVTLDAVMHELGLSHIDWFKTDSQGTDLRLFLSLNQAVRSRVLAVDLEPGLIDAYRGEDLFTATHQQLLREGFWLSDMAVCGTVRCRPDTLEALQLAGVEISADEVDATTRSSPGWTNVRYLKTVESLLENRPEQRDFALLWTFAMIDAQWGFALDVALAYGNHIARDDVWQNMTRQPIQKMRDERTAQGIRARHGRIVSPLKKLLRQVIPLF